MSTYKVSNNFFNSFFGRCCKFFSSFLKKKSHKFLALTIPKKSLARYSQSLGFTLIEVLVVMIMVGILSAIVAPSWLGFVNNQRLSASQTRIFSTLKDAQSSAKTNSISTTFIVNNDPNKGIYVQTNRSQAQYLEQNVEMSITKGSTTTSVTLPVEISFNAKGLPSTIKGLPPNVNETVNFLPTDSPLLRLNLNVANSPNRKRCITIVTLLGATRTGSDTECN